MVGLFVEDIDLLNVAALPFCRELGIAHREGRTLDPAAMARALPMQAERVREAVASAAERTHVPYSFRVMRGRVEVELLEARRVADLVALIRKEDSRTLVLPADLPLLAAPEAASMLESLPCPVVLVR